MTEVVASVLSLLLHGTYIFIVIVVGSSQDPTDFSWSFFPSPPFHSALSRSLVKEVSLKLALVTTTTASDSSTVSLEISPSQLQTLAEVNFLSRLLSLFLRTHLTSLTHLGIGAFCQDPTQGDAAFTDAQNYA